MNYYNTIINDSIGTLYYKRDKYRQLLNECNQLLSQLSIEKTKNSDLKLCLSRNFLVDDKNFCNNFIVKMENNIEEIVNIVRGTLIRIANERIGIINRRIQEKKNEE